MSTADEFLERLPYSDGAWRGRFISGIVFFSMVSLHGFLTHDRVAISQVGAFARLKLRTYFRACSYSLVAALLVFAIGSIIDAMTAGFIVRGVSISLKVLNGIFNRVPMHRKWARRLWVGFTILWSFPIWPLAILVGTIVSSAGFNKLYTIGLCRNGGSFLTPEARKFFNNLPTGIREGLDEPFSDKFDAAWQGLIEMAPPSQKHWVNRLGSRNYELASFLASALIGMMASMVFFTSAAWSIVGVFVSYSYTIICILSYLFFGCISIVRRSIFSVLELLAISALKQLPTSP